MRNSSPRPTAAKHADHLPRLLAGIYIPSLVQYFGPYVTDSFTSIFVATSMGRPALAGMAIGVQAAGQTLSSLPVGMLMANSSPHLSMVLGTALYGLTSMLAAGAVAGRNLPMLLLCQGLGGVSNSMFLIGRAAYFAMAVPHSIRGRSQSVMGGCSRIAAVLGPIAGGAVAQRRGLASCFVLRAASSFVACLFNLRSWLFEHSSADPHTRAAQARLSRSGSIRGDGSAEVWGWRRLLHTFGATCVSGCVPMCTLSAMRAVRTVFLPLVGQELGLSLPQIGRVVTAGSALDVALFLPAGWAYDKLGRKQVAVVRLRARGSRPTHRALWLCGYVLCSSLARMRSRLYIT